METAEMKTLSLIVAVVLLAAPFIWTQAQSSEEKEAVRQAVLDYVEGVYQVDLSRIERSIHPDLKKLGFSWQKEKESYVASKGMTFAGLIEVAKNWNKERKRPTVARRPSASSTKPTRTSSSWTFKCPESRASIWSIDSNARSGSSL
jgi:hypothetical protein